MSPVLPSNWSFQIEEKYKEPYTFSVYFLHLTVADLSPPPPPPEPKFFQFHAVFGKIWQNRMLAPPRGVGAPSSGKSWIRHCLKLFNSPFSFFKILSINIFDPFMSILARVHVRTHISLRYQGSFEYFKIVNNWKPNLSIFGWFAWILCHISQTNFTNVNVKFQNNIVNDKSHYFI